MHVNSIARDQRVFRKNLRSYDPIIGLVGTKIKQGRIDVKPQTLTNDVLVRSTEIQPQRNPNRLCLSGRGTVEDANDPHAFWYQSDLRLGEQSVFHTRQPSADILTS